MCVYLQLLHCSESEQKKKFPDSLNHLQQIIITYCKTGVSSTCKKFINFFYLLIINKKCQFKLSHGSYIIRCSLKIKMFARKKEQILLMFVQFSQLWLSRSFSLVSSWWLVCIFSVIYYNWFIKNFTCSVAGNVQEPLVGWIAVMYRGMTSYWYFLLFGTEGKTSFGNEWRILV